ncbi:hypothetical protein PIB30_060873 [Stylosanthes scabra]|uniref:Uncharacterized protein n=1 Tax=Stylosanthes scabra TaxID=79078 RepID=A0ABU6ZJD4_9FABA|nr:hypothetical protein [Stylosanthes scabra]
MKEAEGAGPRSILPSSRAQTTVSGASASDPVASAFTSATSVPPTPSSSASKAGGKPSNATAAKPFSVEREEGAKEDSAANLRQKRRKRKVSEASAKEAALRGDFAWKHKVNPSCFGCWPDECPHPGDSWPLGSGVASWDCSVCVENTFAVKVQLEKELATTKDQADMLTAEKDSALAGPLLHAKIKSLSEELERAEEVEERAKVQAAELESCRSALAQEKKKVESLTQSLKGKQTKLDEAEAAAVHWHGE